MTSIKNMIKLVLLCFLSLHFSCKEDIIDNFENELAYPVNLNVSFNEETESATLTWDQVEGADGYTIWYSFSETSSYTLLGDVSTTNYTDTAIERETQRYYKVKAYNSYGASIYCVAASATNSLIKEPLVTPRAMWVWRSTDCLEDTERTKLFTFCNEHNIEILYFSTGRNDYSANASLLLKTRTFIAEAHNNNIDVHGLTGDPSWILPENQHHYLDAVRSIVAYNNLVEENERFDGYQSDIEPNKYVGDKYSTEERIQNLGYYVDVHKKAADIFSSGLTKPNNFQYGMAISAFYDLHGDELKFTYEGKNQTTLLHLADLADYFAIMSYRDNASSIIEISENEVNLMGSLGKKAWTGVETIDTESVGAGPSSINFFHEGVKVMEEEIVKVKDYYKENEGFGGMAIHYYKTYSVLKD